MLIKSVATLMVLARLAAADEATPSTITLARTCVEAEGVLDDAGRVAAKQRLTRVLEERDLFVVDSECGETYRVEHSMAGRVLVIRISGPHGIRRWTDPNTDKLLPVYRAMVESILDGGVDDPYGSELPGTGEAPGPAPRANVAPPAPFGVTPYASPDLGLPKPSRWYVTIGGGGLAGGSGGVAMGGGYRYRTSRTIIDARLHMQGAEEAANYGAGVGLYTTTQRDGNLLYAGGGLELSAAIYQTLSPQSTQMSGGGLAPFGTAGIQFGNQASRYQLFAQAELSLPFYVARNQTTGQSQYPATFSVVVGLGW